MVAVVSQQPWRLQQKPALLPPAHVVDPAMQWAFYDLMVADLRKHYSPAQPPSALHLSVSSSGAAVKPLGRGSKHEFPSLGDERLAASAGHLGNSVRLAWPSGLRAVLTRVLGRGSQAPNPNRGAPRHLWRFRHVAGVNGLGRLGRGLRLGLGRERGRGLWARLWAIHR